MCLFKWLFQNKEQIEQLNGKCMETITQYHTANMEGQALFANQNRYAEPLAVNRYVNKYQLFAKQCAGNGLYGYRKCRGYGQLQKETQYFFNFYNNLGKRAGEWNQRLAERQAGKVQAVIGNVESRPLDGQQRICIAKEVENHLVIAGAGTGKTTTIIGKIKYLLSMKCCTPEEILVLSFTNASAAEMNQRILKETGQTIEAVTFHKLGKDIISKAEGITPKVTKIELDRFIKEALKKHIGDKGYLEKLNEYFLYGKGSQKMEFDFTNRKEYEEYLALNPPVTLLHETVKSYGEVIIANFLYQNGIVYEYEKDYELDTRTEQYGQYRPDFYLPDYGIYIEYFGINKAGEVPEYFHAERGKTPSQEYKEKMEWKRELHKKQNTCMIEVFAYENMEGMLLECLRSRLTEKGVKFAPKEAGEIWEEIVSNEKGMQEGICKLFETVINLLKNGNLSIEQVRDKNEGTGRQIYMNSLILDLIEPVFTDYQKQLHDNEEIDFNDMINVATECIRQNRFIHNYKYVIVDEYQDMAKARVVMLEAMRRQKWFSLFCVGDDWQSIYRFAGSDVGFILNFERYWGACEISRIETTYRFPQSLVDVSGRFVMENPVQLKKRIRSAGYQETGFALEEIKGYTDKFAMKFTYDKITELPYGSSVYLIGRYQFDKELLNSVPEFKVHYNNVTKEIDVIHSSRADLQIRFLTAHKSKGLQADYVFIINNKNSRMGFPSKIQEAEILNLLLEKADFYPFAEERRLFYVALTRAKKKVFLVQIKEQESIFAQEISERHGKEMKKEVFTCPRCKGRLLLKKGKYGEFLGCSNYKNGCKYTRNIGGKRNKG